MVEDVEGRSNLSFFRCAPVQYAEKLGLDAERVGGAWLTLARRSNSLYFTRAVGLGLEGLATESDLDGIIEWYRERGARRFTIDVSPLARPDTIGKWMHRRGFRLKEGSAKHVRRDAPPPAVRTRLSVVETKPADAEAWFRLLSTTWSTIRSRGPWFMARVGAPGWRHYMAFDGDAPAGVAALYVHGRAARLADAVTLPQFRRKGAQGALIGRRIRDGLAMGARVFCSETAPPLPQRPLVSYRNMQRSGFSLAYIRPVYVYDVRA